MNRAVFKINYGNAVTFTNRGYRPLVTTRKHTNGARSGTAFRGTCKTTLFFKKIQFFVDLFFERIVESETDNLKDALGNNEKWQAFPNVEKNREY